MSNYLFKNHNKLYLLRDTFLAAEKEYLEELKKDPEIVFKLKELSRKSTTQLVKTAVSLMHSIENGEVKPEDLEKQETEMLLCLLAIYDKYKEAQDREISEEKIHRIQQDSER